VDLRETLIAAKMMPIKGIAEAAAFPNTSLCWSNESLAKLAPAERIHKPRETKLPMLLGARERTR